MPASFKATLAMLAAAVASAIVAALPAAAQAPVIEVRGAAPGAKMRVVSYRDLNLNLIAHRRILDERVERAVREVCNYRQRDPLSSDYRLCADTSWGRARPQLTQAYVQAAQRAYRR